MFVRLKDTQSGCFFDRTIGEFRTGSAVFELPDEIAKVACQNNILVQATAPIAPKTDIPKLVQPKAKQVKADVPEIKVTEEPKA